MRNVAIEYFAHVNVFYSLDLPNDQMNATKRTEPCNNNNNKNNKVSIKQKNDIR